MSNPTPAFLTGSRAYGTPNEDSDYDICLLVTEQPALKALRSAAGLREKYHATPPGQEFDPCILEAYNRRGRCGFSIKIGKLNLLVCTTQKEYDCWKEGNTRLIGEKRATGAVTRERAVQVFDEVREKYGFA